MATTLTSLSARVSQTLLDTGNTLWPAASITEGIRSALGEYNLAAKIDDAAAVAVTLNGLDNAAATTLPEVHDTVIMWGAAGYCAQARAIDRADSVQLGTDAGELKAWADARLKEFKVMLGAIFPGYLTVAISNSSGESDPALTAAQISLLTAQAGLASSQASHVNGQESREAAAAEAAVQAKIDEAARLADIRTATNTPWGSWTDEGADAFDGEKPA